MGAVFGGATQTPTRANESSADCKQQTLGLLNLKAMTDPTALAGTTGTEASLIHGETWNQMEVNQTENVLGWQKFTVTGVETHKALSNLVYSVQGTTNDTRTGVHNQTNISPRNDEFMHTRSELHHQKENRKQLTEDIDFMESIKEFKKEHYEFNWLKYTNFFGLDAYTNTMVSAEAKMVQVARKAVASENTVLDCEIKEIGTALGIIADQVKATVLKASAAHLKAIGFNGNAGIAANGDSPLG